MSYKIDRMANEIAKELSIIVQSRLDNPNIAPFTSISDVILSKDIKYATVFIIVPIGGDRKKTVDALNNSAGYLRHELSKSMRELRTVPALNFKIDTSNTYGKKIDDILKTIKYDDTEPQDT